MATSTTKTTTTVPEPIVVTEPVAEVTVPAPVQQEAFSTAAFSPETFSTELVTFTKRLSTVRETAAVRRRRLRHLGYI